MATIVSRSADLCLIIMEKNISDPLRTNKGTEKASQQDWIVGGKNGQSHVEEVSLATPAIRWQGERNDPKVFSRFLIPFDPR